MRKLLTAVALLLSMATLAQTKKQAPASNTRFSGLDQELEKILADWHAAGFAVAVVEKNSIVYAKGFGVKDIRTKQPVDANTLFAIGSCTKAFTSTLIGKLVQDGKLNLDEPVTQYLPELRFYNNYMDHLITLRDMMSHKTGLPRHDLSWYFNQSENRDSLIRRIRYMEPTYRPKEKYQYNNFMFLAQGVVTEKLTGMSWEKNMRDKLLTPLGMQRTNMPYTAVQNDANLASPHDYRTDSSLRVIPHYNISGMNPAGGVYSSVNEMANWIKAWINGGKYNGVQVIPPAHLREATSAQSISGSGTPDSLHPDILGANYGFGWSLTSYRGHYRVEHGGAIDGFIATTSFFPSDSFGIVVLSNQTSRQVPTIVRNTITDRMLGLSRPDWNKEQLRAAYKAKIMADSAKANAVNKRSTIRMTHPKQAYEGLYEHPAYGIIDVHLKKDSLFAQTARYDMWLLNWHYNIFAPVILDGEPLDTASIEGIAYRFNTDVNGEISSITAFGMEAPSINLEFKKSPRPKAVTADELKSYAGAYNLNGVEIIFSLRNNVLYAEVPNQPHYELVPLGMDRFALKNISGFHVQFEKENGKTVSATFQQPNGNFKATKK